MNFVGLKLLLKSKMMKSYYVSFGKEGREYLFGFFIMKTIDRNIFYYLLCIIILM